MRTTIALPSRLKQIASTRAVQQGISFSEFVRRAVEKAVAADDPFFLDKRVFRGRAPRDLAARHDDHLYGKAGL